MRRRFAPECGGLEQRLALSFAYGFVPPPSPPATVTPPATTTPTDPTDIDPGSVDPTDPVLAIKAYPTNTGSTSPPTLPA